MARHDWACPDPDKHAARYCWAVPVPCPAGGTASGAAVCWPWISSSVDVAPITEGQPATVSVVYEPPMMLLCGSGVEEAAIVVRNGLDPADVRSVAIPREGGMKDLTALGLIESLGWQTVEQRRFPSGDGAIICFFGRGADAASMVEPYAAMLEELGVGRVVRRTGDIWPGAPGCSLTAAAALVQRDPDLVQRVVNAYVRAMQFVHEHPDRTAEIAAPFIGVDPAFVRRALLVNGPDADAVRHTDSMQRILHFMQQLGYVKEIPTRYADLSFLDKAQAALAG